MSQGVSASPQDQAEPSESPLSGAIDRELDALRQAVTSDAAERAKLRKAVERLRSAWLAGDGSAERVLKEPSTARLRTLYPQADSLFSHLTTDLQRQRSKRSGDFERMIRRFCEDIAQPCDGKYPRLTVAHFVELSVDENRGRVKVGATSVRSLDWTKIQPALEREVARVWKRPFEAGPFRDTLLGIYEEINTRTPSPTGYVKLAESFRELRTARASQGGRSGGRLSAYYRDEFCADLSKLWSAQMKGELTGTQLEFTSIRQAQEGFSVILPSGDIATYGFVKPRR